MYASQPWGLAHVAVLWDVRVIFRPLCSCHGNSKSRCVAQTAESSLADSLLTAITVSAGGVRIFLTCLSQLKNSADAEEILFSSENAAEITSNMYVQGTRFSSSAARCHEELPPSSQITICGTRSCEGLPSCCAPGRHLLLCMTSSALGKFIKI